MIPGTKTLLFGPPGGGKSHSLRTLLEVKPDLEVFCLFTEPSGMAVLGDTPPERLHWNYIAPSQPGFEAMIKQATNVNTFSADKLFGMEAADKNKYQQFIEVLRTLSNFKCQRTGKEYGSVDKWDASKVLVIDSLSGLNLMVLELVSGGKAGRSLPEWGVAIDQEAKLINMLTLGCPCNFVLIAHIDREIDAVLGGTKILPAAIGKKLPAEIGRFFDDLVYAQHDGTKFIWSTQVAGADTKARLLPITKELKPSFVQIFEAWKKKGGVIPPSAAKQ